MRALYSITACIVFSIFVSCEKVVYLEVDTQVDKLVVNSIIAPGAYVSAQVTLSADPLAIGFEGLGVDDATITITRNGEGSIVFENTGDGFYELSTFLNTTAPGDALSLEVSAPGRTPVQASTVMPGVVPITSVEIIDTTYKEISYSGIDAEGNVYIIDTIVPYYAIELIFTDPEGGNNYSLEVMYQDAMSYVNACFTTNNPIFGLDNRWVSSTIEQDGEVTICEEIRFPDYTYEGEEVHITLEVFAIETTFVTDPKFIFILNNLSDDYYAYAASSSLQQGSNGDPFSEPVVVFSNIEGGFGIFAGYTSSQAEVEL